MHGWNSLHASSLHFLNHWRQMGTIERFISNKKNPDEKYKFSLELDIACISPSLAKRKLTNSNIPFHISKMLKPNAIGGLEGAYRVRVSSFVDECGAYLDASPQWVRFVYDKSSAYALVWIRLLFDWHFPRYFKSNVNEACAWRTFHQSMMFTDVSVVAFMLINTVVSLVCRSTGFHRMSWIFRVYVKTTGIFLVLLFRSKIRLFLVSNYWLRFHLLLIDLVNQLWLQFTLDKITKSVKCDRQRYCDCEERKTCCLQTFNKIATSVLAYQRDNADRTR